MRKNLIEFLFGSGVVVPQGNSLGEHIVKLYEEAADEEGDLMVASKKPLADALKAIGISGTPTTDVHSAELRFEDGTAYREAYRLLHEPEHIHRLAEMGWVAAFDGDIAQTNEPAEYKLNFVELTTAEGDDKDKPEDLEKIRKQAQEYDTTPMDRKDKMNPVDNTRSDKKGEKRAGIGKEAEGKAPEGKPKGAKNESVIQELGGYWCTHCRKPAGGKLIEGQWCCETCHDPLKAGDETVKSREAQRREDRWQSEAQKVDALLPAPTDECELGSQHAKAPFFKTKAKKKPPVSETTMAGAVPAVEAPMGGPVDWGKRLKKLRQRRGEAPDDKPGK